jgi:TolB-like protein
MQLISELDRERVLQGLINRARGWVRARAQMMDASKGGGGGGVA